MQLEDELGTKLFSRKKHRITLTDDGMLLKQRAIEIVALEDKIHQDLSHQTGILSGTISIGSGETQAMNAVAKLAADFHQKHPQVQFEIRSGVADEIKDKIENGVVDIGLLSEPVDIGKYEFIHLKNKEQWGVLMTKDHPLAKKISISPEDLKNLPLIMAKREVVQNEIFNWFGEEYDHLNIVAHCDLLYNTEILVRNHVGAAVCIENENLSPHLCFRPLAPSLYTGTVLVWKKHRLASNAVQQFIQHAKKCL